jgi:hypothetical protein
MQHDKTPSLGTDKEDVLETHFADSFKKTILELSSPRNNVAIILARMFLCHVS